MSLSTWEQQALDSIKDGLAGSDPELAALLTTFSQLAADEEMPARVTLRARSRRAVQRSRQRRGRTYQRVALRCALLDSYRFGGDPAPGAPAFSTYLGHVDPARATGTCPPPRSCSRAPLAASLGACARIACRRRGSLRS